MQRVGVAKTQGIQRGVCFDTGPREITATFAGAHHHSPSCIEGHLRPGMPPKAIQDFNKRGQIWGPLLGGRVKSQMEETVGELEA